MIIIIQFHFQHAFYSCRFWFTILKWNGGEEEEGKVESGKLKVNGTLIFYNTFTLSG